MDVGSYVAAVAVGTYLIVFGIVSRKRSRAIRALALLLGFSYFGKALPNSVNFVGTEIAGRTDVWNVIEGKNNGSRIVAFDCRIGYGKASWRTTVIATQGQRRVSGLAAYALKVERAEGWSLVYRPNGLSFPKSLMPVAELAAHLQSVG